MTVKIVTNADAETGDAVVDKSEIEGEATTVEDELDLEEEDNEWGDLAEDNDEVEETHFQDGESGDQETAEEEVTEEETAAERTDEIPAETETEVETEVSQETEEVIVDEAPQEQTAEEQDAAITEARRKATESLEQQFQLTEEMAEDLIAEPNKVLPQMLAKMYLDVFTNVMQGMQQQLPSMIQGVVQNTEAQTAGRKAFHDAWPQLDKADYHKTVERIGAAYKQANPKATREEFIAEVGAQAWVSLRLPLDELLAHTQKVPDVTADPKVTPLRAPAGPGNVPASGKAPVQKQQNAFEDLADELLDEDSS